MQTLSACRHLTSLDLLAPVTSAHPSALLPRLQLNALTLFFCRELDSLQFLSDVPSLHHTLRYFGLEKSSALRTAELRHLLALKNLDTLELLSSFSEALDGLTQHLLTPPSIVLPKLTKFKYEPAVARRFRKARTENA